MDVASMSNGDLVRVTNGCGSPSNEELLAAEAELKQRGRIVDVSEQISKTETEAAVSADARYIAEHAAISAKNASGRIIKHLWIIFVLLPVVLGVLIAIAKG